MPIHADTHPAPWTDIRGVCFDMGGTLVRPDIHPTTGQVARVLGISLEDARAVMECGAKRRRIAPDELARELATAFHRPALLAPLEKVLSAARDRAADPELFDDTVPTLTLLRQRGFALFAMTNSLGSSIPERPPALHQFLDAAIYSADSGACKPERAAFAAVESIASLAPHQLLHVGDSERADVAGALAAGWHAVFLRRGESGCLAQADADAAPLIRTLASLADLLPAGPRDVPSPSTEPEIL
jgi:putative hydrolase of the HAD superfamily